MLLLRVKEKLDAAETDMSTVSMDLMNLQGLGILEGYTRKHLFL